MPERGQSLSEHRLPGDDTAEDEDHTDRLRRTELFVHEPHTESGPHNRVDQPDQGDRSGGEPPETTAFHHQSPCGSSRVAPGSIGSGACSPYELTPTELSATTMVTSGAVTKRVDRLERLGLVGRRVSASDGRGRVIELTGRGRALVDRLHPLHLANEDRLLHALDTEERGQLAALLRKLLLSLE